MILEINQSWIEKTSIKEHEQTTCRKLNDGIVDARRSFLRTFRLDKAVYLSVASFLALVSRLRLTSLVIF